MVFCSECMKKTNDYTNTFGVAFFAWDALRKLTAIGNILNGKGKYDEAKMEVSEKT